MQPTRVIDTLYTSRRALLCCVRSPYFIVIAMALGNVRLCCVAANGRHNLRGRARLRPRLRLRLAPANIRYDAGEWRSVTRCATAGGSCTGSVRTTRSRCRGGSERLRGAWSMGRGQFTENITHLHKRNTYRCCQLVKPRLLDNRVGYLIIVLQQTNSAGSLETSLLN